MVLVSNLGLRAELKSFRQSASEILDERAASPVIVKFGSNPGKEERRREVLAGLVV